MGRKRVAELSFCPSYLQVNHGDWFCGKAVGLLVLHLSGLVLNAYVTHVSEAGSM